MTTRIDVGNYAGFKELAKEHGGSNAPELKSAINFVKNTEKPQRGVEIHALFGDKEEVTIIYQNLFPLEGALIKVKDSVIVSSIHIEEFYKLFSHLNKIFVLINE
ncbi:MAG: hypothetical protein NTZ44_00950 [Candidatus Nomurabacteria bacterium]|nr:hypothetical protein [Candidatus Nomurabacteria bacterium]